MTLYKISKQRRRYTPIISQRAVVTSGSLAGDEITIVTMYASGVNGDEYRVQIDCHEIDNINAFIRSSREHAELRKLPFGALSAMVKEYGR